MKREKKAVRKTVKEIMGDEVTDATLTIINKYRKRLVLVSFAFSVVILFLGGLFIVCLRG